MECFDCFFENVYIFIFTKTDSFFFSQPLGCDLEMSVLERIMHLFDRDGDGTIDVEEFVSKMTEGDESGGSSKGEKEEYRLMWLRHFL